MRIVTEKTDFGYRRALEIGGEQVSWLQIRDYQMRIGPATVRMGGIAGVGTHHRHRMKGYSRRVMEDSTTFMKAEGFDVAVLFGIDNFYHKFDYAPCMPEMLAKVRTKDAEAVLGTAAGYKVRPAKISDHATLAKLYNGNTAWRTGTLVRAKETFGRFHHGSEWRREPELFVVEDPRSRFAGYIIQDASPAPTTVCEVETTTIRAYPAILAKLVKVAIDRRDGEIALRLPPDHPFLLFLRRFGCSVDARFKNTGGPMGRIINQDTLLAKISEAYRCECGGDCDCDHDERYDIEVKTDLGRTRLSVPGEAPKGRPRVELPAMDLFQVLMGFRDPIEVLSSAGAKAASGGDEALEFLYPGHEGYMYAVDYF